jgi:HlyD family secretion protein
MSIVAVPSSAVGKRRIPWAIALVASLVAVGVFALVSRLWTPRGGGAITGEFHTIAPTDLDITISKDGELQAVNNVDIVNPVEGSSVVLDIVKEGTYARKGDVVVRIDDKEIREKMENATLDLQKAQSALTAAKESKDIQESKNTADLEAAQVELTVARLDLLQYTDGDFPKNHEKAKIAVEMAQTTLKNKQDDLAQTKSLFGKGFVTAAEVKKGDLEVLTAQNDLQGKIKDLNVLEKFQHEKDMAEKKSKVVQAERRLLRVQRENASSLSQRNAELQNAQQALALRQEQFEHLQEQLAACVIKAPADGMVLYGSSGPWARRESPIQPGATVRQQELLIRLPDTSSMKLVAKINETQVTRLSVDPNSPMRATLTVPGQTKPLTGWLSNISVLADSSQRFWNPDSKEYPVDVTLDFTPPGLKPGMRSEATIFIDRLRNVLAVPLGAVYAAGRDSYVFVKDGGSVRPTKVTIGEVNETHAQLTEGISSGQQVLILAAGQGRELLDKAGIKVQQNDDRTDELFNKLNKDSKKPQQRAPAAPQSDEPGERRRGEGLRNRGNPSTAPTTAPAAPPIT